MANTPSYQALKTLKWEETVAKRFNVCGLVQFAMSSQYEKKFVQQLMSKNIAHCFLHSTKTKKLTEVQLIILIIN